jgi:hypothetical protein
MLSSYQFLFLLVLAVVGTVMNCKLMSIMNVEECVLIHFKESFGYVLEFLRKTDTWSGELASEV